MNSEPSCFADKKERLSADIHRFHLNKIGTIKSGNSRTLKNAFNATGITQSSRDLNPLIAPNIPATPISRSLGIKHPALSCSIFHILIHAHSALEQVYFIVNKAVILQQHQILCGLGSLSEACEAILEGKSAITTGPCFNIPVAFSPFPDTSFRNLQKSVGFLKTSVNKSEGEKILFIYCAAKGDISALEPDNTDSSNSLSPLLGEQARLITHWLGITPSRIAVLSSACASGAAAVETARELLEREQFSTAVIFGFDVISHFVTSGFHALSALSPSGAKPFDKDRDGLSLGDGAALAVFTYREPDEGDIIVAGSGSSNDANHRTGPSRTGEGLFRACSWALECARKWNPVIGAIKCHGTATVYNDAMEAKAISRLFTDIPPCFSVKGAIGHTSGAGSLIEILLASWFLKLRKVPPTAGFEVSGVDEQIPVSNRPQNITGNAMLCLSAGFGGLNCAVVLKEFRS